jgi:hypothetical protein
MTRIDREFLKLQLGTAGVLLFITLLVYLEVVP